MRAPPREGAGAPPPPGRRAGLPESGGLWLLVAVSAAASLPGLRSLPTFGDEAIFLRLARLVRSEPLAHAWVTLRVAAAPVHTWLLAAALALPSADPVWCGRLVSVVAGLAMISAIAWTVRGAIRILGERRDASGSPGALTAAALLTFSPFFLTSQRLARVDTLFALATVLVAGASLRGARKIAEASGREALRAGAGIGALLGILMLTRTAVSYPFWAMPVAAVVLSPTRPKLRRAALWLAASLAVGLALFAPYLLVSEPQDLSTRLFHLSATHPRIPLSARIDLASANGRMAAEALWRYLSPPVVLGSVAAAGFLAARRRWRLLACLLVWEGIALLPPMIFASNYFPRYALPAAVPLLALVSAGVDDFASWSSRRWSTFRRRALLLLLAAILLAWPGLAAARFVLDWRSAPWLPIDRFQLVTGWPAGAATEAAVRFLAARGAERRCLVLTPEISGNPTDTLWLLLEGRPGIDLAFAYDALRAPLLYPSDAGFLVREDLLRGGAPRGIPAGDHRLVFFAAPDPFLTARGWRSAQTELAARNPTLVEIARFENPPEPASGHSRDGVVIFQLR